MTFKNAQDIWYGIGKYELISTRYVVTQPFSITKHFFLFEDIEYQ